MDSASPAAPQPLDYARPDTTYRFIIDCLLYYLRYTLMTLTPVVFALTLLVYITPRCTRIFAAHHVYLPALTRAYLTVSGLTRSGLWIVIVGGAFFLPLLPTFLTTRHGLADKREASQKFYRRCIWLLTSVILLVSALALLIPLAHLYSTIH